VGTAGPGDTFVVLGRNDDGSWIMIEYPDLAEDQEAWIAEFLLEIGVEDEDARQPQGILVAMAGPGFGLLAQSTVTEEAATETRDAPTTTPTLAIASPTAEIAVTEAPPAATATLLVADTMSALPLAEPRWNAMTIGLLFIIGVIILGALLNIARALLRRG
jgi:hypothetical protein